MSLLADIDVIRPRSLSDALQTLHAALQAGAPLRPMAGCTDVLVEAHFGKPLPTAFLDVTALGSELGTLDWQPDGGLQLGALTTYAQALEDPRLAQVYPALAKASALVGAVQIQARGTYAGNVENGSPAADGVPALMALDARVRLASVAGVREVPLDRYYTGYRQTVRRPDELIVALVLPAPADGGKGQYFRKVGTRAYQAITKVGLAARLDWQQGRLAAARVVAIAMAPTICRCPTLEAELDGKTLDAIEFERLRAAQAEDLRPISDLRSTDRYRAEVFARLLQEAVRQTHAAARQGAIA